MMALRVHSVGVHNIDGEEIIGVFLTGAVEDIRAVASSMAFEDVVILPAPDEMTPENG